jgi:phage shock protein E
MRRTSRTTLSALLALVAAGTLLLGACSSDTADTATVSVPPPESGKVVKLTPEQGAALVKDDPAAVVIDVRTPEEFAQGHIEGARNINLEGATFTTDVGALDKSATYVVYCHSGNRSGVATKEMVAEGFTRVYDLGGIQAWQDAGQKVVTT